MVLTIFLIIKNIYPLPNSIRVLLGKGYIFFSLWEKIYNVMRMEPVVYFKFLVFIYHTLILSNMKNSLVLSSSLAIVCLLWPIMFDIHLQKSLYNYKEGKKVFSQHHLHICWRPDCGMKYIYFLGIVWLGRLSKRGFFFEFCLTIKITSIFFSFLRVTKMTN